MREHHSLVRQTEQQAKESMSVTKKRNTRHVQGCPLQTSLLTICTIVTWNLPGLQHRGHDPPDTTGQGTGSFQDQVTPINTLLHAHRTQSPRV